MIAVMLRRLGLAFGLALAVGCRLAAPVATPAAATADPTATQALLAILASESEPLARRARACQQLGEIGTAVAVPALAAQLSDEHLGAYARQGLEANPDPSAGAALRDARGRLQGAARIGVVNSLGVRRDREAVPALTRLAGDPGSGAAREALLALGRIGTGEAVAAVREALTAGSDTVRADAAAGCLLAAEGQLAEGRGRAAAALCDAVRTADVPLACRVAGTRGAIVARGRAGTALLLESLRSPDPALRLAALGAVREIPSEALADALAAELERAEPELQAQLLTALADCRSPRGLRAIRSKATAADPTVRQAALAALARTSTPADAEALLAVIGANRDTAEVALAVGVLGRMAGTEVDGRALEMLAAPGTPVEVRVNLIRLLGGRTADGATAELLRQAADADPRVGLAACEALRGVAEAADLPALLALTRTCRDDTVRSAAEGAVCAACAKAGDKGGEAVLAELRKSTDAADRCSWIRVLATLGYAPALPTLQAALGDADARVAATAAQSLGRWPDPAPTEALLGALEGTTDAGQHRRLLTAVAQLAGTAAEKHQQPDAVVAGWFGRANRATKTVEDKRLVISGLARLPHAESVRLLVPYLADAEVRAEAAHALLSAAGPVAAAGDAALLGPALDTVAGLKDPALTERANALRRDLDIARGKAEALKAAGSAAKPRPLFDGKTFAGWEGDTAASFRIEDGAIVGGNLKTPIPRNEFLATTRTYANFVLSVECRLRGPANGGIQFRSARVPNHNEVSGYQADMDQGGGYWGSLWDESRRGLLAPRVDPAALAKRVKADDWNQYVIRCEGPHIRLYLNNLLTADYTETDPAIPTSGIIAVQIHGGDPSECWYRNLTIEELP